MNPDDSLALSQLNSSQTQMSASPSAYCHIKIPGRTVTNLRVCVYSGSANMTRDSRSVPQRHGWSPPEGQIPGFPACHPEALSS